MNNLANFFDSNGKYSNIYDSFIDFEKLKLDIKRIEEMHEYSKDPEFYKFMETGPSKSIKDTKEYLELLIQRDEIGSHGGDSMYWAVIDKLEDKMIGTIGFQSYKKIHRSACTTIGISLNYRSKGRAIEALISLLAFGFGKLDLHRVWAITHEKNYAVIKLHEMLGFKVEGVLRDYYIQDGKYIDAVQLSCMKNEYTYKMALKSIMLLRKMNND